MAQQKTIKRLNQLKGKSVQEFVKLYTKNIAFIDSQENTQGRVKHLRALGTAISEAFMDYSVIYSFFKILEYSFIFIKLF